LGGFKAISIKAGELKLTPTMRWMELPPSQWMGIGFSSHAE